MSAMWLGIEPLDVLLFRDSRPFTGGESHRARSLFPPSPLTFQGALRGKLLEASLESKNRDFTHYRRYLRYQALTGSKPNHLELASIVDELGSTQSFGKFRMKGPFVVRHEQGVWKPFFPLQLKPRSESETDGDKRSHKSSDLPILVELKPLSSELWGICRGAQWDGMWPLELLPLWSFKEGAEEAKEYWLTAQGMKDYLLGHTPDGVWFEKAETLCTREPRAGIRLRRGTRTVEQGMLYMAEFLRLQRGVGFAVEVRLEGEDDDAEALRPLREEGLLALGGEARAARHKPLDGDPLAELKGLKQEIKAKIQQADQALLKLYLAAPAVFSQGWKPDFLDSDLKGRVNVNGDVEVQLVAAAVGKPLPLGGWDLALGRPKPLRQAVPPGSVYYLRVEDAKQAAQVIEAFHCTCRLQGLASDPGLRELEKIGFGLTFVGVGQELKIDEPS